MTIRYLIKMHLYNRGRLSSFLVFSTRRVEKSQCDDLADTVVLAPVLLLTVLYCLLQQRQFNSVLGRFIW